MAREKSKKIRPKLYSDRAVDRAAGRTENTASVAILTMAVRLLRKSSVFGKQRPRAAPFTMPQLQRKLELVETIRNPLVVMAALEAAIQENNSNSFNFGTGWPGQARP